MLGQVADPDLADVGAPAKGERLECAGSPEPDLADAAGPALMSDLSVLGQLPDLTWLS